MDWALMRDSILPTANQMQLRQASVVSVEAGGTCTVSLAGTTVAGVVYWQPPCPGAACWVSWQGGGPMVVGAAAASTVPSFAGIQNGATSLANATWVAIPNGGGWATETDPWGMVDAAGTFTAPCDGMWQINASASFASNSTGLRGVRLLTGATTLAWAQVAPIAGTQTALACAGLVWLAKGGQVVGQMNQTSGAALNTGHMAFSVAWVSG